MMTAKEYLSKLRWAEVVIAARKSELAKLDAEYKYLSGITYDRDRVQTSPTGDMFPQSDRRIDLALSIKQSITELQLFRAEIVKQIAALDDPNHVRILTERYVNNQSFDSIAALMNYSYDWITHLHGEALQAFTRKHPGVLQKTTRKNKFF
jgi:hypothetical protein